MPRIPTLRCTLRTAALAACLTLPACPTPTATPPADVRGSRGTQVTANTPPVRVAHVGTASVRIEGRRLRVDLAEPDLTGVWVESLQLLDAHGAPIGGTGHVVLCGRFPEPVFARCPLCALPDPAAVETPCGARHGLDLGAAHLQEGAALEDARSVLLELGRTGGPDGEIVRQRTRIRMGD